MGEARRRGSKKERIRQGIEKREAEYRSREAQNKFVRLKPSTALALMLATEKLDGIKI